MAKNNTRSFSCAFSADRHYVIQPIALSCGHSICKTCVPLDLDDYKLKCKLCGRINKIEFDDINETSSSSANIDDLLKDIEKRMSKSIKHLKENIIDTENRIKSQVDKLKDEIDDHAKILKKRIDRLNHKLQDEVDRYKKKLLEFISKIDIDEYEKDLESLKDDIDDNISYNKLSKYENKLRKINNVALELDHIYINANFVSGKMDIDRTYFGKVNFEFGGLKTDIGNTLADRLQGGQFQVLAKNIDISELCLLPDDSVLVASCKQHNLMLYNKHFEFIETVDKINDKLFSPLSLTTDGDERIFINDSFNQRILMTDLSFNFLGEFGQYGNGKDKLRYPNGICFAHNELYVSDRANNRIVKLTPYLKHIASFEVEYQPSKIKILNYVACIKSANTNSIYFYDLSFPPYFNFINQYDEHSGTINVINSNFYEFNYEKKKLYCFNQSGSLDKTISIKSYNGDLKPGNETMFLQANKNILIACSKDKRLIKL